MRQIRARGQITGSHGASVSSIGEPRPESMVLPPGLDRAADPVPVSEPIRGSGPDLSDLAEEINPQVRAPDLLA